MRHRTGLLVLVVSSFLAAGCSPKAPSPQGMSEEEARVRKAKAEALFQSAQKEPPSRKIEILRTLVGLYPESERAVPAHYHLVFYLLDQRKDRPEEALEAAITFADRHPEELLVSQAFRIQDSEAGTLDHRELRGRIQKAWWAWLEKVLPQAGREDIDTKARFWYEAGDCLRRMRRPEEAVRYLEEAREWDIPAKDLMLQILSLDATILAQDLGRKEAAVSVWEKALVLARAGVRGETPEQIEGFIAALR